MIVHGLPPSPMGFAKRKTSLGTLHGGGSARTAMRVSVRVSLSLFSVTGIHIQATVARATAYRSRSYAQHVGETRSSLARGRSLYEQHLQGPAFVSKLSCFTSRPSFPRKLAFHHDYCARSEVSFTGSQHARRRQTLIQ